MEAILNFVLKSGIGLLVLYLFYYAVLRNQITFGFNRLYLLLAPMVAIALPLIKWPALFTPAPAVAQALQAFQLNEVLVVAYNQDNGSSTFAQLLTFSNLGLAVYLLVALFLLFRLFRQLWHIYRLKSEATVLEQTPDGGVQVMQLKQPYPSFAFLNFIFLSNQSELSAREKQQVVAHELAHVQLGHTYDVLYYELLSVALWFNPVVWVLKQELRSVHEFQADARVLEQHQPQEYVALLSKEVLFNMGLPVGSYFQKPQVLRRLQMLQQHNRRAGWIRPLLTLPLLLILLVSLTSRPVAADIASQLATASQKTHPNASSPDKAKPEVDRPQQSTLKLSPDATTATPAPAQSGKMPIMKGDTTANMPVRKGEVTEDMPNSYKKKDFYTYVEQMPQFKGGEAEMLKYLGENIRYPEEAKKAGIEGIVVASMIVEMDGTLSDIHIIKGLGMGTDEEVIRVIKKMSGNWLPGRQVGEPVRVQYTLPVRFTIK